MKQGGVCKALGETCFCVNQSGLIREHSATPRNNLQEGERRHQEPNNWYQSFFPNPKGLGKHDHFTYGHD